MLLLHARFYPNFRGHLPYLMIIIIFPQLEQNNSVVKIKLVGNVWGSKHSKVKICHFCFYLFK